MVQHHLQADSYSLHTECQRVSAISAGINSLCENTKPAGNQSPTSVVRGVTNHIGVSSLQFCSLNNFLSARRHSSASSPHACRTRVTPGVGHHFTAVHVKSSTERPGHQQDSSKWTDRIQCPCSTAPQNASKCHTWTRTCAYYQPSSNNRQF